MSEKSAEARRPKPRATRPATFGAGCFWGVEAAFRRLAGVVDTAVGFMGGHVAQPTYRQVCTGRTGHAEVVRVEFEPAALSYEDLLAVFWESHDPTQFHRQGPDIGSQYRSVIFFHDSGQREAARASRDALAASGAYRGEIVTEIVPAAAFWPAEEHHQRYLEKRGLARCRAR
ncbi:MAG: peptide-methionine (S)-S-oxide reductase MsrA [Gemmatimonadota bacterium]